MSSAAHSLGAGRVNLEQVLVSNVSISLVAYPIFGCGGRNTSPRLCQPDRVYPSFSRNSFGHYIRKVIGDVDKDTSSG